MGEEGDESDDSMFRDIYSSPKQQEQVVKEVGYNASPYHRETRDLLSSLGLTPEKDKDKLSEDNIKEALEDIVKTEDLETLTRKRAALLLEEKLDVTLTSKHKTYIKNTLGTLVAEALQTKTKKLDSEEQAEKEVAVKRKRKASEAETQGSTQASNPSTQNDSQGNGIPLTFPKSLGSGAAPFLVELQSEKKVDFSGDTGAVGRLSIIAADGKRYANSPEKSRSKQDKANAKRFKQGSVVRLDMKGDVYHGILKNSKVTACFVTVSPEEARVNAVFNEFVQATFKENILANMQGQMIKGDIDVTKFTYDVDADVNAKAVDDLPAEDGSTKAKSKPKSKKKKA